MRLVTCALAASVILLLGGCGGGGTTTPQPADPSINPVTGDHTPHFTEKPRDEALLGKGLLPDLMTQVPQDLEVQRVGAEYRLLLTNTYTNVGLGDMRLEGTLVGDQTHAIQHILDAGNNTIATYDVSTFLWHPAHGHWHINNVALYELRKGAPDGPTVASATKVTFCMIDLYHQYPGMPNSPADGEYFGCNDQYQGLSVGFSDIYSSGLPDQWIVINDLPRGIYYLVSTVDPTHQFIERDDYGEGAHANNPAWAKVRLDPTALSVQVLETGLGDPTLRK